MKKISSLIALALCVVVGGVFATWSYVTGGTVEQKTSELTIALEVKTEVSDGTKGTITITPVGTPSIKIDDSGSYKAGLVASGQYTITFTPSAGANDEIKKGIKLQYTLTGPTGSPSFEYDGRQIFTAVDSQPKKLNGGNVTLTTTLTAETIMGLITLGDFTLDTPEKYTAFQSALGSPVFTLTVSEATV